jgi:type I restriction enzyme S subunit
MSGGYTQYQQTEILGLGILPINWRVKRVKHLFSIGRGRVISQEELENNGRYPVYSSQTNNNGCLGYIDTYDFDCEQLTWTTDGANAGTIFFRKGKHNCTNVCGTLKLNNKLTILNFSAYSLGYCSQFHKRPDTNGAKIMNNEMAEICLPLPSKTEQEKIVAFLDHETAKIDTLIDKQQQLIELLKEKRQAVISHAVTKGLDPDVPMKDSGVEWLGEVPEHWDVIQLKYITSMSSEKIKNINDRYVGMENISSGNGKYIFKEEVVSDGISVSFNQGDVLFGKLRPYLAKSWVADFSGVCSSEFLVLRALKVSPYFLNYYLLTNDFIEQVNSSTYGSKMPRASWDFIGLLSVPICSYKTSEIIALYLDKITLKIDTLIELQLLQIELLKERRTALISAAVTGKIDVRDWQVPVTQTESDEVMA